MFQIVKEDIEIIINSRDLSGLIDSVAVLG